MRLLIINDNTLDAVNGVVTTFQNVLNCINTNHPDTSVQYLSPHDFANIKGVGYPDLSIPLNLWKLGSLVDKFAPTHVHIGTEGVLGIAAKRLLDRRGWAYTTSFHTRWDLFAREALGFEPWGIKTLLRWFHSKSKRVLVTTAGMAYEVQSLGIDNTLVWSRGVDHQLFEFQDHEPGAPLRLVTVGRVSVEKRMERFCELDPTKYHLTLVGDGPHLSTLQSKYPHVKFTGSLRGRDLAQEYQKADVFVFTSESDTFGLVMIESMATGTPVAALPVRGPLDVIEPGVTGYLDWDLDRAVSVCSQLKRSDVHQASQKFNWITISQTFLDHLVPIK